MNAVSVFFMILAMVIVWGGLAVSTVFLVRKPELADGEYPPGPVSGED